jgi:outer membrane protein assembly factor BamB
MPSKGLTTSLCLIAALVALLACKWRRSSPPPAASAPAASVSALKGPAPTWEVQMPGGYAKNATAASVIGETLVVQTPSSVAVFDRRSGKKSWGADLGGQGHRDIALAEDVVVVGQTKVGGRDFEVFDLATGKVLWRLAANGAGFSNGVYTNDGSCSACAVTRRDLHTGKPKWTVTARGPFVGTWLSKLGPAATGSMIAYRGAPYVMLRSTERGEQRVYAMDAETGARHAWIPYVNGPHVITDRTLVGLEPESRDCKVLLRGTDIVTGKTKWRIELRVAKEFGSAECPGRFYALNSDRGLLGLVPNTLFSIDAQGRPIALDLDTGGVRWTGPNGLVPVDADERTVLVRDAFGVTLETKDHWAKGRLAALDAATGKLLWKAPQPPSKDGNYTVTAVYGDIALDGYLEGKEITVRDARTGIERPPIEGSLIGAGPGWLVATHIDKLRYHTLPSPAVR